MAKRRGGRASPEQLEKLMASMVSVKCAFCKGTGRDPFGALSPLSACQVCGGKGQVRVKGPVVECVFCGGSGVQPHTTDRLHCMACKGKGWVTAIEAAAECPDCNGTGLYLGTYRQHCPKCNGQGVVSEAFTLTRVTNP